MTSIDIQPVTNATWMMDFLVKHWGADYLVSRGHRIEGGELSGAQAVVDGGPIGLITWQIADGQLQIVTLNSLDHQAGIGTALLEYAFAVARVQGLKRVWLVTTNDNLDALRFYQRRGMRLCAIHPDAVTEARRMKPEIPEIGYFGIPIWDEIELERLLA